MSELQLVRVGAGGVRCRPTAGAPPTRHAHGQERERSGTGGRAGADARTLAVACHDLGEFATHYPAGRFLVHDLKGKECAMRLLAHANDEVRKQALLCTQKLLVAKWRFLDGPGGGEVTA